MTIEINELIQLAMEERASDIHLRCNEKPIFRIDGVIRILEIAPLQQEDLEAYVQALLSDKMMAQFKLSREIDFAYEPEIQGQTVRLRVNVFTSQNRYGIVMRIINEHAFDLDSLGFPDYQLMKLKELLCRPRGLILVAGPCGSGKSTTLAAMIDYINKNFSKHIITIEDPIEYVYQRKRCIITQRELGKDTNSFQKALSGALRQDPDVILVGEMRDLATMEAAVSAAETGHLVLSTLHTTGSVRTVDRIIDAFTENSKALVRAQLSTNLISVVSQVLCKRRDSTGRIPAFEIMVHSDAIGNFIRENKTFRIANELETNQHLGMIPLDAHLFQLYQQGKISDEEALNRALYPKELKDRMQNNPVKKKGLFSF
jgi:twitching motility protein PilT